MIFDLLDRYISLYKPTINKGFFPIKNSKFVEIWYDDDGKMIHYHDYFTHRLEGELSLDIPLALERNQHPEANFGYEHLERIQKPEHLKEFINFHHQVLGHINTPVIQGFLKLISTLDFKDLRSKVKKNLSPWICFKYQGKSHLTEDPKFIKAWQDIWESRIFKDAGKLPSIPLTLGTLVKPISFNDDAYCPWNTNTQQVSVEYRDRYADYLYLLPLLALRGNLMRYRTGKGSSDFNYILYVSDREELSKDFFDFLQVDMGTFKKDEELIEDAVEEIKEEEPLQEIQQVQQFLKCVATLEATIIPEAIRDNTHKIFFCRFKLDNKRYIPLGGGEYFLCDVAQRYEQYLWAIKQDRFKDGKYYEYYPRFKELMQVYNTVTNDKNHLSYVYRFYGKFIAFLLEGQPFPIELVNPAIRSIRMKSYGYLEPWFTLNAFSLLRCFLGRIQPTEALDKAHVFGGVYGVAKTLYDQVRSGKLMFPQGYRDAGTIEKKFKYACVEATKQYKSTVLYRKYFNHFIEQWKRCEGATLKGFTPNEEYYFTYGMLRRMNEYANLNKEERQEEDEG
jgi:hypothetical protein